MKKINRIQGNSMWLLPAISFILMLMIMSPSFGAEDVAKFPSRPITFIIPTGAGGSVDSSGRKLADLATPILGQPLVAANKPGGGQIIGTAAIAAAPPDGYTLGIATFAPLVVTPHTRPVPYNTKTDFTYLMSYGKMTMFFCIRADARWKTFKEFVEEARKNPGKLTYSTVGTQGAQHVFMEYVFSREKVNIKHVPYDAAEIVTNVLGGHIDAGFAVLLPWVQGGNLRALAIQGDRVDAIPEVPTFFDLGYGDQVKAPLWLGVCGPKGLDPRIGKKLGDAFKKASEDPSFKELCAKWSIVPGFWDSGSFTASALNDFDTQGKILRDLGFTK